MLRSFSLAIALVASTQEALALDVVVTNDYEWTQWKTKAADVLCQKSATTQLDQNFDGLETLEINRALEFWESDTVDGTIFMYPNLTFRSQFGDVDGQMTCIIPKSVNTDVEVAISFEGRGLAGSKMSAMLGKEPSEAHVTFSVHLSPLN